MANKTCLKLLHFKLNKEKHFNIFHNYAKLTIRMLKRLLLLINSFSDQPPRPLKKIIVHAFREQDLMSHQTYCNFNQRALQLLQRSLRHPIYHNTHPSILFPRKSHGLKLKVKQDRLKVPIIKYKMPDQQQRMGQLLDLLMSNFLKRAHQE